MTFVMAWVVVGWSAGNVQALEIVVPAYFYPSSSGSDWDDMNTAAAIVPITAIMNPASGPGNSQINDYVNAVGDLRTAGGRVIAYVASGFGNKPLQNVLDEIDLYDQWYDIDGIFIDEMSNSSATGTLDFYQAIYDHVKTVDPAWELMGNPGINTAEAYLTRPTADRLIVFESFGSQYLGNTPSAWNTNHDSSKFVNLLHDVSSSVTADQFVDVAVSRNVGSVYFTDDVLSNPWDRLPTYWDDHVAKVAAINNLVTGVLETQSNPVADGTISIDGSRADWASQPAFMADSDASAPGPELDFDEIAIANDSDELFLRVRYDTTTNGQPAALSSKQRVFLDTDGDRATGYTGGSGEYALGADFMVFGDRLFEFQGSGQQVFSWGLLANLLTNDSPTDDVEIALSLADIGSPTEFDFFLEASNTTTNDYLPNAAEDGPLGTFYRYTVGAAPVTGDYDNDGDVDSDDYIHWRDHFGSTTDLSADGNGDGIVNAADYTVWRDALPASATAIPEPDGFILAILSIVTGYAMLLRKKTDFLRTSYA